MCACSRTYSTSACNSSSPGRTDGLRRSEELRHRRHAAHFPLCGFVALGTDGRGRTNVDDNALNAAASRAHPYFDYSRSSLPGPWAKVYALQKYNTQDSTSKWVRRATTHFHGRIGRLGKMRSCIFSFCLSRPVRIQWGPSKSLFLQPRPKVVQSNWQFGPIVRRLNRRLKISRL